MERISCIFCHNNQDDPILISEKGFFGRKCRNCGLVYISPRPGQHEIQQTYTENQASISASRHVQESFLKQLYAKHHLAIIHKFCPRGDLLEIGSGGGHFLVEAKRAGYNAKGIELNPFQADFIRKNLGFEIDEREILEAFEGCEFDLIYHCDVISHFFDPIKEFRNMNRRLRKDGYLIFETGCGDFDELFLPLFSSFQYPDHLFFFSEGSLKKLLHLSGFKHIQTFRWSIIPHLLVMSFLSKAYWLKSKIHGFLGGLPFPKPPESPHQRDQRSFDNPSRRTRDFLIYLFRYWLGRLFPKRCAPNSILVIAQKKESTRESSLSPR